MGKEEEGAGREDKPIIEKDEHDLKEVVVAKQKFTKQDDINDTETEIES